MASASSHREAPLTAGSPQVDNTDVYAFVAPDAEDSVTLIANWLPFQEPNGGPNFYPFEAGARYNLNIDNDGDGQADIVYRYTFANDDRRGGDTFLYNNGPVTSIEDETLLFQQTYTLERIEVGGDTTVVVENGVAAPSQVGPTSTPNYKKLRNEAITEVMGGGNSYAGAADDSFFLDLRIFDLLYGTDLTETGQDTLSGYNVNTIALQVPKEDVALNNNVEGNPVVGVWSTTEKQSLELTPGMATPGGDFVQVSRLGNPLINEVVLPVALKDAFNGLTPDQDATIPEVVDRVLDPEVPKLIEQIYGVEAPATPRNDLQEIFLTGIAENSGGPIAVDLNSQLMNADVNEDDFVPSEMLRLNLSIPPTDEPNRLGVLAEDLQGFPNGRRLTDDVVDIELQALMGAAQSGEIVEALADGDGVNANDVPFTEEFPYIGLPNVQAVNAGNPGAGGGGPNGGGGDNPDGSMTMPTGGVGTGAGGSMFGPAGVPILPLSTGLAAAALLAGAFLVARRRYAIVPREIGAGGATSSGR